jgi:POU domain transcription factor, class 4
MSTTKSLPAHCLSCSVGDASGEGLSSSRVEGGGGAPPGGGGGGGGGPPGGGGGGGGPGGGGGGRGGTNAGMCGRTMEIHGSDGAD